MSAGRSLEAEIKGTTLRVYWHLLKVGEGRAIRVRETQRSLGLSSPSVALHHLEKLRDLGLLQKLPSGEYMLVSEVKVGVLANFVNIAGLMLPRFLFYSTFFTTMVIGYLVLYPPDLSIHSLVAIIIGVSAALTSWLETVRAWRNKPF